jgi:hypothetical protein
VKQGIEVEKAGRNISIFLDRSKEMINFNAPKNFKGKIFPGGE